MSRLSDGLKNVVSRLFRRAGYQVTNITRRQQADAAQLVARQAEEEARFVAQQAEEGARFVAQQQAEAARLSRERWRWLDTLALDTLIDVGANTGQFARHFRGFRPDCLIYSFEPLRDCFAELQQTMADVPGFTAFNVALGESDEETEFFRSAYSESSSLLQMGESHKQLFPFTRDITTETVTLRRLDSYIDQIIVRGGLMVKIDVQGAEARVLRGGRLVLSKADAVVAEVGYLPLYVGQATLQELAELLDDCGLTFMGTIDQNLRPGDSLPIYGDALFVRRATLQRLGHWPAPTTEAAPAAEAPPAVQRRPGLQGDTIRQAETQTHASFSRPN